MDPLSIATGVASLVITASTISTWLINLIGEVRNIDSTISDLAKEVTLQKTLLSLMEKTVRECHSQVLALAHIDDDMWNQIRNVFTDCKSTLSDLHSLIHRISPASVNAEAKNSSNMLRKTGILFQFNIYQRDFSAFSSKVYKSNTAIQTVISVIHISLTFRTTISQKDILQELQTLRNFVQKALKDSLTSEEEASDPTITLQVGNLIGLANSAERFRIAASTTASSRHEPEEQPWSVPGSEHGGLSDDRRQQIERWAVLPEDTITETTASKVKEGSIVINSNSSLKDISAPSAPSESTYEIQTVYGHTDTVNSAVFSPSGRILASGSDDATIRTWEVIKSGQLQQLQTLEDLGGAVSKLVFSPDGESLAGIVGGNEIYFWNLDGKNQLRQTEKLTLGSAQFLSMAFLPSIMEPFFVTGLRDGRILQWHSDFTPDRTSRGIYSPSGIGVISISFFQRSTRLYLISGSQNGTIQIYKWSSSGSVNGILSKFKKPSPVPATNYWCLEWSYQSAMAEAVSAIVCTSTHVVMGLRNHTSLTVEYEYALSLGFNFRTDPRQHRTYSGHTDEVCCVATTRQGHDFASGSEDHSIKIWGLYGNKTLNGHSNAVRSVSFSPDGRRLVSASVDHTIRVWRLRQ